MCAGRILPAELHRAFFDEYEAEQADLLEREHGAALARPVRLAPVALDEMRGLLLDPFGRDLGTEHRVDLLQIEDLAGQQPARRPLRERRGGEYLEFALARSAILIFLVLEPDLCRPAAQQRAMHGFVFFGSWRRSIPSRRRGPSHRRRFGTCRIAPPARRPPRNGPRHSGRFTPVRSRGRIATPHSSVAEQQQLPMQFAPLAHAQIRKESRRAPVAQLRLRQVLVRERVHVPEIEDADEVGLRVGELRMRGIGRLTRVGRPFARILDRQECHDDQQLALHAEPLRLDQHACERDIDRQRGHLSTDVGQLVSRLAVRQRSPFMRRRHGHRAQFAQAPIAVADRARVRHLDEREIFDVAKLEAQHAQDHACERRTQDFRIGELLPRIVILLAVEPQAHAGADAAATPLALLGRGLRDRFDVQAFELVALRVALHARGAGVDHVLDARHRERCLGDVRREHDAPLPNRA